MKSNNKLTAFQEKWLQALESGEYKQAKGFLCLAIDEEKSYCCLGVACEVFNEWAKEDKERPLSFGLGYKNHDGEYEAKFDDVEFDLPIRVQKKLMLRSSVGTLKFSYKNNRAIYVSLSNMNDYGLTHAEIAKYIRENPENVFLNFGII